ncbi:uncharacterized protein FYW61_001388 isoform 2-T2 [Anableps anableps]
MRVCLIFIFFLGATFSPSVKSKSHGKQYGMLKTSHSAEEKDVITVDVNRPEVFPTLATVEAGSQGQEDKEVSSGDNTNTNKEDKEIKEKIEKRTAVLLSEEELVDLLKKEAEEDEETEEKEEDDIDMALAITEGEVTLKDEKKPDDIWELEKKMEYKEGERDDTEEEETKVEEKVEKSARKLTGRDGQVRLLEETESSTESELPADLDYAADSGILIPAQGEPEDLNPSTENQEFSSKKDLQGTKKKEMGEKEMLLKDMQSPEAGDREEVADQSKDSSTKSKEKKRGKKEPEAIMGSQKSKSSVGLESGLRWSEKEEEKGKSDSGAFIKRKTRKQKKNKRARKHSPQRNETNPVQDQGQLDRQESVSSSTENVVHKAKRKWNGKWGALVGVNPVQIRASMDLNSRSRSSFSGDIHLSGTPPDPCDNFQCKRGKTCKHDADGKPGCVCQEPLECPRSINKFEHVKKIFENERRLHAGNHSVELLTRDFEKNYNMYIYPVHWQFAQLDQHPSDRILSHSELAPLRVPLVPMEHCTSLFFQECDADKDKQVTLKEWTSCFGIKAEDMDVKLLF